MCYNEILSKGIDIMNWVEMDIYTTTEGIEAVTGSLLGMGINGFVIKDAKDFQDFLDDKDGNWDYIDDDLMGLKNCETTVTVYLPENALENLEAMKLELKALKKRDVNNEFGRLEYELKNVKEEDWANNWKQYFKQFYVDDILIIPSWEEVKPEDRDKMIIHIDPGTAFGTGMHETTQLCIRQLKKYVTKDTELLDVGTGSGILSIIALKLGARHAVGTDLDPCAVPAVEENKEVNGIPVEAFDMMIGNIIDDKEVQDRVGYEKYDIVTANILADVLVPLTPVIVHQMKPGAVYITSGILDVKEEVVKEAVVAAGLEVVEVTHQGEWVSVTARKPM